MLLAEQGVVVSYESIWRWCLKFGRRFALQLEGGTSSTGRDLAHG